MNGLHVHHQAALVSGWLPDADDLRWRHLPRAEQLRLLAKHRPGAREQGVSSQSADTNQDKSQASQSASGDRKIERNESPGRTPTPGRTALALAVLGFPRTAWVVWAGLAPRGRVALTILVVVVAVPVLASFAPSDFQRPVNRSAAQWIGGNPCRADGGVQSAVETNATGAYKLDQVRCNDGLQTTASTN